MDYNPRAETVRLLAMAAYLPGVPIALLVSRQTRDVRLIRFHAYQGIGLAIAFLTALFGGSVLSSLLGGLPAVGWLVNLAVGVLFLAVIPVATAIAGYGAVMAFQGNYTSVPVLTDWVWMQVNGSRPPARRRVKKRRIPADSETFEA